MAERPDAHTQSRSENAADVSGTPGSTISRRDLLRLSVGGGSGLALRGLLDVPAMRGRLSFDGQRTGIGLADFLLGYPQSLELATASVTDARLWMMSGFFQDDLKITPKLTVLATLRIAVSTSASATLKMFDATAE